MLSIYGKLRSTYKSVSRGRHGCCGRSPRQLWARIHIHARRTSKQVRARTQGGTGIHNRERPHVHAYRNAHALACTHTHAHTRKPTCTRHTKPPQTLPLMHVIHPSTRIHSKLRKKEKIKTTRKQAKRATNLSHEAGLSLRAPSTPCHNRPKKRRL